MIQTIQKINAQSDKPIQLQLTDLFPNQEMIQSLSQTPMDNVQYSKAPLDATKLSSAPAGLKTMIASFHHMPPAVAKAILKSAFDNRQTILIYEVGQNNIPTIIWWILLPISIVITALMCVVLTLFARPLSFGQLFFTYIIPIIPLAFAWDGQASIQRTYTFEDIDLLLSNIRSDDYTWEVKDALKANGKKAGYYILGMPI